MLRISENHCSPIDSDKQSKMMLGQNLRSIDSCDLTSANKCGRLIMSALKGFLIKLIGRDFTKTRHRRKSELMMYKALNEERRVRLGCVLESSLILIFLLIAY
jgi:hypothetical protein